MNTHVSNRSWTERAHAVLPAGNLGNFNSGVVLRDGQGARVRDTDGNEYIDFLIGSGPMLLGHGHPEVVDAVNDQLSRGMTFFANNTPSIELAEELCRAVACAEQVRFFTSGSEADMYALRLARAVTGRDMILKFEGGFHGMTPEALMSQSPLRRENFPLAVPDSAGIPVHVRDNVLVAPFNDADATNAIVAEYADRIAAVIVEPTQRLIPADHEFLTALRTVTSRCGILLIFDEIVTGFRKSYGCAQDFYGITPDICTLGKVIGGGFPLAAVAASEELMACFDRERSGDRFVMQVGTLSGNPVAATAGLKTLEILRREGTYDRINESGRTVISSLQRHLGDAGFDHQIVGDTSLFDVVFTNPRKQIRNYRDVLDGDAVTTSRFNAYLQARGILKSAAKYYPCAALTGSDLDEVDTIIAASAAELARTSTSANS